MKEIVPNKDFLFKDIFGKDIAEKTYKETGEFRTDYAERPDHFGGYQKVDSELRMIVQEDVKNHNKVDKSVGLCG